MLAVILVSSSLVTMFLILWFRTEVFVEYCRLFKLDLISRYKDYDDKKKNDVSLTYHGYLRQYHNRFCTRLITCPICMAVWLSMGVAIFFWHIALVPVTFVCGMILFGVIDRLLG